MGEVITTLLLKLPAYVEIILSLQLNKLSHMYAPS